MKAAQSTSPNYDVPALRKAVAVLELLAGSEDPLGVSEISRGVDIPKNMAFRLLVTLDDLGWVRAADEKPRYQLTLKPFRMFAGPVNRHDLSTACQAPLRWLHRECKETVFVGVMQNGQALNVQVIDGRKTIRVGAGIGSHFDLHCTAHGKVLLAHADEASREEILAKPLKRYTENTLTNRRSLEDHLEEVKRLGYAVNNEEYGRGLIGVAAPVFDESGQVQAAIGVFLAIMNLNMAEMKKTVVPLVMKAAEWASLNSKADE